MGRRSRGAWGCYCVAIGRSGAGRVAGICAGGIGRLSNARKRSRRFVKYLLSLVRLLKMK